jgi:M6 family metalloprotease-like protein
MRKIPTILNVCGFALITMFGLTFATDLSRGILLDVPQEIIPSQFGKMLTSQLTPEEGTKAALFRFTGDTLKILVALVEWDNRPGTYSPATFDSLFFSRDVLSGGSVADYYYEVSYGQVTLVGQVVDWYNAGLYTTSFNYPSLFAALDPIVDYSQFDGNHNGDVDGVFLIRAGTGYEDSHNSNDIWSFAQIYSPGTGPGSYDGVRINGWNTTPETQPLHDPSNPRLFSGFYARNRVRVFCHFLAHCLALPDLFDHDGRIDTTTFYTPGDYNDHPVQDWDVMGYEGYGIFSLGSGVPSHFCGWTKKEAGWIDPVVLSPDADYHLAIPNIETTKDSSLYLLPINPAEGEYFLLEYRNPNSTAKFDKLNSDYSCFFWPALVYGGDSLNRGLIITHVHDSLDTPYYRMNYGTPDYPHYRVKIEDAGYNPSRDAHSNPEGWVTDSSQWWYPYETQIAAPFSHDVPGQEIFSYYTNPSSCGYFAPSWITVRVDSIVDSRLYAYVRMPGTFLLGNTNSDETVDVGDVVYLINYLYKNGSPPVPQEAGDTNCDGLVDVGDVVYLINYLFKGGPPPSC